MQSALEVTNLFTMLDGWIFALTIGVTIGAIIFGHRMKKGESGSSILEHLLMGRQLTLPLFVATLVSTWYGGIFGVTRIAFEQGIYNFLTQGVFWYVTYAIFAWFLVKRIKQSSALTLPELVGDLFGERARKVAAVFNFFNVVPIAYAVSLGLLSQAFFGGSLWANMLIWVAAVCAYAVFGGFRAVVFSDVIQFAIMCFAVACVFFLSVQTFGGWDFLQKNLPETHFDPTGGVGLATTLVWGIIALSTLVDPNFYQRVFAAKSERVAKRGIFWSIGVWFLFDICTTAGGMYAAATIPDAAPESAYLIYALQLVPEGLRGLVVAGIVATIVSTIDSYIFLAATTLTYDLGGRNTYSRLRFAIAVVAVGGMAVALGLAFDGNIKDIWKTLGSYSAGCLLLPVLAQIFGGQRFKEMDFLVSCFLAVLAISYWRFASLSGFWAEIDDLYIGVAASALGLLGGSLVRSVWTRVMAPRGSN